MSHTTNKMKDTANAIARIIEEQGKVLAVSKCYVDDFGKYGNFQLLCGLELNKSGKGWKPNNNNFSLIRIVYLIKRVCKNHKGEGAILRQQESPQGIYTQQRIRNFTESYFEGYERNYIMIDLDFIPYHSESNTFAVQAPFVKKENKQLKIF